MDQMDHASHRFDPKHVDKLVNPERRKMLPPEEILSLLDIRADHAVADIGCGPGYFTIPLAAKARTVYGVDVSHEMLRHLSERAQEQGLNNITLVESPAEHVALADASVDRAICSLVLHEVDDLALTIAEFKRILRPGGKLLLIEWEKKAAEMGPPLHIRLASDVLLAQLEQAGFHGEVSRPNPEQYIIAAESE